MKRIANNRNDRSLLNLVSLSRRSDGKVAVKRKRNAMSFELNKCVKMIVLITSNKNALDVQVKYRLRNNVEKLFETLKDEIDGGMNYLSSRDFVSWITFIEFASISLRYVLTKKFRTA
ncbi:MAG: hypothetical protein WCS17_10420 [Prevotella sp.]